jgi:hypothetical protein
MLSRTQNTQGIYDKVYTGLGSGKKPLANPLESWKLIVRGDQAGPKKQHM